MTSRRARKQAAIAPLVKPPVRLDLRRPEVLVQELREIHERFSSADSMPDNGELYSALLWAERHSTDLGSTPAPTRRKAAVIRVRLWQHLRENLDRHQLAAVDDARAAGAEWAELAEPLAVRASSAAYNRAARMRSANMTTPDGLAIRRTPEALAKAQAEVERELRESRRREAAAAGLHAHVYAVASRLIACRQQLPDDEDLQDWLDEVEITMADCATPAQQARLHRYVTASTRAFRRFSRERPGSLTMTTEAVAAVAAAEALPDPDELR
ncbi:hypothetical protein ACFY4B_26580 [Kitasatospora sp. NPDC001261]|uniref:hypothetical protein n=1 Tax=Kitasatospora sp. NPDC001261 TaxID=3364012 RepID=UPI0036B8676B